MAEQPITPLKDYRLHIPTKAAATLGFFKILSKLFIAPRQRTNQRSTEQYGQAAITDKGERVRSGAERQIANWLARNNIRYVYEKETSIPVYRGKYRRRLHPDFYLIDHKVYIEYWGMVNIGNNQKREQYVKAMKWKMAQYHSNHIKFISLYPNNLANLDYTFRAKFKEVTGQELPQESTT